MLDESLGWIALIASFAGAGVVLAALYTWPRGGRCRCPGPRGGGLAPLDPRRWLDRGRCWYDLTGLAPDDGGMIRCPECGRRLLARRAVVDGRRLRIELFGAALLVVAVASFATPWTRGGQWTRSVPSVPLVVMAQSERADAAREEVERRVTAGSLTGLSARMLSGALIVDLRDDEIHGNARRAETMLVKLWPDSWDALEAEVAGDDLQSRYRAAQILRRKCTVPSDELLRQTVAELRDDRGLLSYVDSSSSARVAAQYLQNWAGPAEPMLRGAMESDDPQQRLLAASIAGFAGRLGLMGPAVPILVEHLRDNEIRGDAKVAAPALYHFGPDVLPRLRAYADIDDPQARRIILSLIEQLEHPERRSNELEHPMPRLTGGDVLRRNTLRDVMYFSFD